MPTDPYNYQMAIHDFQAARQKAGLQEVLARLRGKSTELLSYEEVADKLHLQARTERGLQNIPLDAIVGSVGRYTDFTRTFLPRRNEDLQRWAGVKAAMQEGLGLPPIEVYKVGEAYFVIDGNHRVSVARQEGFTSIQARVIEINTPIKLSANVQPDELIIQAEYAEFLHDTRIHELRPNVDLSVTVPGQYEILMAQIHLQRFILVEDRKLKASLSEAAADWYDNVYVSLAETIRDRGLLHWFPGRTLTDLYIWISENRTALEKESGWELRSEAAAADLILERSIQSEPGSWRRARTLTRYTDRLFNDILVPLSGDPASWAALEQAILIAEREGANLHGLHIVTSAAQIESPAARAVQARYQEMCQAAGVHGNLNIEAGDITRKISERSAVADLIVLKIVHPPQGGLSTLRSPFRAILSNASRPVLGVPAEAAPLQRALLAFDGSERSKEALFVATYLAEMWKTRLIVFSALDGRQVTAEVQDYARRYLDLHEVEADYILGQQGAMQGLKQTAEDHRADLILMGSHGGTVWQQVWVGSAVDYMLRESRRPLFICR